MEDLFRAGGPLAVLAQITDLLDPTAITVTGGTLVDAAVRSSRLGHRGHHPPRDAAAGRRRHRGTARQPGAPGRHRQARRGQPRAAGPPGAGGGVRLRGGPARPDRRPGAPGHPDSVLVLRGCGPKGYPGMPEVANLPLPRKMLELGVRDMVRVCDGRMSGTAYGTVVLHVAPEAAAGGLLALVQDGDPIVLDVPRRLLQLDVPEEELVRRTAAPTVTEAFAAPDRGLGAAVRGPRAAGRYRRRPRLPGRRERARRGPGVALTAMATGLVRLEIDGEAVWAVRTPRRDARCGSVWTTAAQSLDEARAAVESAGAAADLDGTLLAPVESQEVWAAGVTYERSRDGRMEESTEGGVYDRVYVARRPEVFFKATAAGGRPTESPSASGPTRLERAGARARLGAQRRRGDLRVRARQRCEQPLHRGREPALPAAGQGLRPVLRARPGIVPVWAAPAPPFDISCRVQRGDAVAFAGATSTASITRRFDDLAGWLMAALDVPGRRGPADRHGHRAGRVVQPSARRRGDHRHPGIGTLTNPVVLVGRDLDQEQR